MSEFQLDKGQHKKLLSLIMQLEDLFGVNLVKWDTTPVELEAKHGSEPFNDRYYPVPNIKKETLQKEFHRIVEIGVLTHF